MQSARKVRSLVMAIAVVLLSNYAIGYASRSGESKVDPNQAITFTAESGSGTQTNTPRPRSDRSGSGTQTITPRPVSN